MRLGSWKCDIKEDTLAYEIYGKTQIEERHRHRYEYNNKYAEQLQNAGLISSGVNPDTGLVEIVEIKIIHFLLVFNIIQNIKVQLQIRTQFLLAL